MGPITRREALKLAASLGASLARRPRFFPSLSEPTERRDLFPHGVASGDPQPTSVLLWTRRPPTTERSAKRLRLEVSDTPEFKRIVVHGDAALSADSGWTARVLAAGLKPHREYWYRFVDEHGFSSRVGRTITAPDERDATPVTFVFVSCQNVQLGACNAYRRMIWEDERRQRAEQLDFVLHLGDFIYEIVWYPEDRPQGYYARTIRDIVRYASGEKHADFHVPTTVDDYRAVYSAYLTDPDLQDARARWPFVCMPDNHEFSWRGWQSQENFGAGVLPAQTRKVAANQAWFEFQPARLAKPGQGELSHCGRSTPTTRPTVRRLSRRSICRSRTACDRVSPSRRRTITPRCSPREIMSLRPTSRSPTSEAMATAWCAPTLRRSRWSSSVYRGRSSGANSRMAANSPIASRIVRRCGAAGTSLWWFAANQAERSHWAR